MKTSQVKNKDQKMQSAYYAKTADNYDLVHLGTVGGEHDFALTILSSFIDFYNIHSVLDVGAGTGRSIFYLKQKFPHIKVYGIEPVKELREQAYKKGLSREILTEGYGEQIELEDKSFDLVCEFGMLHHVPKPDLVVQEMLRVARIGIFISDSNNFGQGNRIVRILKQSINALKLWKVYNYIRTRGKVYQISEGDGLFYSYSIFNNYDQIKKSCSTVHIMNAQQGNVNLYRSAPHVVLFGLKKQ